MVNNNWKDCKNILCIRPDNMGDLLMTGPAIRALKESTGAMITVLTSSMAAGAARLIAEIDDIIIYNLPWIKAEKTVPADSFNEIVAEIRERRFDAAVIFTVYSQNPLPAAMLAYLAGVPRRLAYCRENPYGLLTDWMPDKEPYTEIKHQVRRDLDLVASVGAFTANDKLSVNVNDDFWENIQNKLVMKGVNLSKPWLLLHPGVSEKKREYPEALWIETAQGLPAGFQLLITGAASEKPLTDRLQSGIGAQAFSLAGIFSLAEFILLIRKSPLVISVNTGTIHLAAATGTPVIVLYALTNPQHFPWKATGKVFTFTVLPEKRSRNEVIRFVNEKYFHTAGPMVTPEEIISEAGKILNGHREQVPEIEL